MGNIYWFDSREAGMDAALITVGEELLCGDIANTNATWLCGSLDERGVRVQRITTIPDEVAEIARVVNEYRAVYDAVVVTGGLGPTHDDVTMEGVAAAVGQDLAHNEAAASWLAEHRDYAAEDLDPGTTQIPAQARMLPNEVGVAPGAVVEGVYVFPGVPAEMEAMFNRVAEEFSGTQRHSAELDVDEPESQLLDRFADLRQQFDVTVGSYPGETLRVKITADKQDTADEAREWLRRRVETVHS